MAATYARVPQHEPGLPQPVPGNGGADGRAHHGNGSMNGNGSDFKIGNHLAFALGRARQRWIIVLCSCLGFFVLLGLYGGAASDENGRYSFSAIPGNLGRYTGINRAKFCGVGGDGNAYYGPVSSDNLWVNSSGRVGLSYNSPFNPDDLTMTEDECDAFFPDLYKEIDRSVEYFTTKQVYDKEYLEYACDDGIWTHARVVVYNNRLYIKYYQQSDFTRSQATLALLHQAVATSRQKLPNVEFCIGLQDWGSRGKFSLDRAPDLEDVWLMPDYGWWSWPEHVGSYQEVREQTAKVEQEIGWEGKKNLLFWRGSMKVGTADREALMGSASGHDWSDVQAIDWSDPNARPVAISDSCRWRFLAFPEGNTYSGRLRYFENCRSTIVTHAPRWLQHWTHLYNADWNSPDQNIVYVDPPIGEDPEKGILVHDEHGKELGRDRTWERLPETMDRLMKDDRLARKIADNQWNYFRERYISPASAHCYWRKLLWGFSSAQRFQVDLSGTETSYESFVISGYKLKGSPGSRIHRRDGED